MYINLSMCECLYIRHIYHGKFYNDYLCNVYSLNMYNYFGNSWILEKFLKIDKEENNNLFFNKGEKVNDKNFNVWKSSIK